MNSFKRVVAGVPHPPCWVFNVSDMPYKLFGSEALEDMGMYANQFGFRISLIVFDTDNGARTGMLMHDVDEDTPDSYALTTLFNELGNLAAACNMSLTNPAIFDEIRAMREDGTK